MASYQQPSNSFRSHVDKTWTAACKHTDTHQTKRKNDACKKKERKSKKELKIREEE